MRNIIIGITDCGKWKNYHDWLVSEDVSVIKLSSKENNLSDVEKCDAVVLSGGEDVHPQLYNKPEYLSILDPKEINRARDEFELSVIEKTLKNKKPLLGICRGLQIANVYFGGTLIPHLTPPLSPSERFIRAGKGEGVRHSKEQGQTDDVMHYVQVEKNSCLNSLIPPLGGGGAWMVNSAHHQAADKIGEGLIVSARAEDGIIEALELKNPKQHPFFLLVQWHPERMKEQESPFVKNLKRKFITMCLQRNKL